MSEKNSEKEVSKESEGSDKETNKASKKNKKARRLQIVGKVLRRLKGIVSSLAKNILSLSKRLIKYSKTLWSKPRFRTIFYKSGVSVILFMLLLDYLTMVRIVSISNTSDLDARKDVITIRYNKPTSQINYIPTVKETWVDSSLSKDGLVETHKLVYPLNYNKNYFLQLRADYISKDRGVVGFLTTAFRVNFSTQIEKIRFSGIEPKEKLPSPANLNNKITLVFSGEFNKRFDKEKDIQIDKIDYVTMKPVVKGYYRWTERNKLTFFFTETQPKFDTQYHFTVHPDKLINEKFQIWTGKKTERNIKTSENDIHVRSSNLKKGVSEISDPLVLEFSGDMVHLMEINSTLNSSIASIVPALNGDWKWTSPRKLQFTPWKGWPVRKNITVKLNPAINKDSARRWRFKKPKIIKFYVKPITVDIEDTSLTGDSADSENTLIVKFSSPIVARESLRVSFDHKFNSATNPVIIKPYVEGSFYWTKQHELRFKPRHYWKELTTYQIKINPKYKLQKKYEWKTPKKVKVALNKTKKKKPKNSFTTLADVVDVKYYFTPEDRLSFSKFSNSLSSYKETKKVGPEKRLWIKFDRVLGKRINKSLPVGEQVVFKPAIKGKFTWLSNTLLEFIPAANWKEHTQYNITLHRGLLYTKQQHFKDKTKKLNFNTGANVVTIRSFGKEETKANITLYQQATGKKLVLRFSRNMKPVLKIGKSYVYEEIDAKSLPVTFDPPLKGTIEWVSPKLLKITPKTYWLPKRTYRFTVNKNILPYKKTHFLNGNGYYLKTLRNFVAIDNFTPKGLVTADATMEVTFSKPIKPENQKIGETVQTKLFKIEPKLDGKWVWQTNKILVFKPNKKLLRSSVYKFIFDPDAIEDKQFTWVDYKIRNKDGSVKKPEIQIDTAYFSVANVESDRVLHKTEYHKERFVIKMQLTDEVNVEDFKRHFTIWYMGKNGSQSVRKGITYKIKSINKKTSSEFFIETDWIDRPIFIRNIRYGLSEGLRPLVGNSGLRQDKTFRFIQQAIKLITIDGVSWVHDSNGIYAVLKLNAPIKLSKLRRHLSVYSWRHTESLKVKISVLSVSGNSYRYKIVFTKKIEPDERYQFSISKNLLALNGHYTRNLEFEISQVSAYPRELKFVGRGNILSINDMKHINVGIADTSYFRIIVRQLYKNNLNSYLNNKYGSLNDNKNSKIVFNKFYDVSKLVKKDITKDKTKVTIDLSTLFKNNTHGLYVISLAKVPQLKYPDRYKVTDSRWLIATDTGLHARYANNQLLVWATSLESGKVKPNIRIQVYDAWNQVIANQRTEFNGVTLFKFKKNQNPTQIIAIDGNDLSFIQMPNHRVNLSQYDIEGLASKDTIVRSYIYSSRGVYRPGETANIVAVIRNQHDIVPESLPAKFVLTNPSGGVHITRRFKFNKKGVYTYDFSIPTNAASGKWYAKIVWLNKTIGSYRFQVEEFVPNKIDVYLKNPKSISIKEGVLKFKVSSEYKFGGGASGLVVNSKVEIRPSNYIPPGYKGYSFGGKARYFNVIRHNFQQSTLSNNNKAEKEFIYQLPAGIRSSTGLTATISATVLDDAKRGVSKYSYANILMYKRYIGIKKISTGTNAPKKTLVFKIANVFPNGDTVPGEKRKLQIKVLRLKQLAFFKKNKRGYYRYVTETIREPLHTLTGTIDKFNTIRFTPQDWGRYVVQIKDLEGGQLTEYQVNVGFYDLASRLAADRVTLRLLNSPIKVGQDIRLQISTPFAGTLLLTGERSKLFFHKVLKVKKGTQVITLPTAESSYPTLYLSAALVRQARQKTVFDAINARGLIKVKIMNPERNPKISMQVANTLEPNKRVTVRLKGDPAQWQGKMYFTLSAVDTGILDLTNFKLPSLERFFRSDIRLEVLHYTMYHLIMPYIAQEKIRISPSGDAAKKKNKRKNVNPDANKRVKPVALWSGLLHFNEEGEATVDFDIPDFDGTLRFQMVGFGKQRYSMLSKDVLVYNKLIMRPGVPRFFATSDEVVLPVTVFNRTGNTDDIKISLGVSKHIKLMGKQSYTVKVAKDAKALVYFKVKIRELIGVSKVVIKVESSQHVRSKTIMVPVRYPVHVTRLGRSGLVTNKTPVTISSPKALKTNTIDFNLRVSSSPLLQFRSGLDYLLTYPHGCLEQTTSKVFPLLYYKDIAIASGLVDELNAEQARKTVRQGIEKIFRMQSNTGQFYYWDNRTSFNYYSSLYAAHFIIEARKAGFKINEKRWRAMMRWLNLDGHNYDMSRFVYQSYLLALVHKSALAKLNLVYDRYREDLLPHQKARLAMAYFHRGQKKVALGLLKSIGDISAYDKLIRNSGGNFDSNVSNLAIILDAYVLISPKSIQINVLINKLKSFARGGSWGNTQENSLAFMAIGKALHRNAMQPAQGFVTLGDNSSHMINKLLRFRTRALRKGDIRIQVKGTDVLSYTWKAKGLKAARTHVRQDQGLVVRKRFLDRTGKEIDLGKVKQGQLVVVELTINAINRYVQNVAITDLLPAGLEIENQRIATADKLTWMTATINAQYEDIRDDRVNVYANIDPIKRKYYYLTRAVTAGKFSIPEVRAEAMYDPEIFSWANRGQITIKTLKP